MKREMNWRKGAWEWEADGYGTSVSATRSASAINQTENYTFYFLEDTS